MKDIFIFNQSPHVRFATNTFINVPVILQYESTPLIEVISIEKVGFTSQISIYHSDGTYLAVVKGPRLYLTEDGKKVKLKIRRPSNKVVCELEGNVIFELQRTQPGWEVESELYTPNGAFIKGHSNLMPSLLTPQGQQQPLKVQGVMMQENIFHGCSIGILIKQDGTIGICAG